MDPNPQHPRGPLEKPGVRSAIVLLIPAALCSGLFYLWLGQWPEALGYGALLGCGIAAIGFEFFKFILWHRAGREDGRKEGSAARALWDLARGAFRVGFVKTFTEVLREIFKLVGLKVIVSIVIAVTAFFVVRTTHLF